MATIGKMSKKAKKLMENLTINEDIKVTEVTLAGKTYTDITSTDKPVGDAYIQCSWFDDKQMKFMEEGLKAIGLNPTVSLEYSHHPLSHQYKNINVNEHPEVMDDLEWQQATLNLDITAMKLHPFGIALYMPSDPDVGISWESGFLYASHKPNLVVIPKEETTVPINLMMIGNTQIITIDKLATFDFNKDFIYKPYTGKVF